MPIPMRSRFEYGGVVFETELAARPWTPADETIGGSRDSAAGVPASYVVRRDALVDLPLRIEESEWTDFLALIAFGQSAQAFIWFPDADDAASFSVYLKSPPPGLRWAPARSSEYPQMFEVTITLRGVSAAPWVPYF